MTRYRQIMLPRFVWTTAFLIGTLVAPSARSAPEAEPVRIRGLIVNGTTGRPSAVAKLELIDPAAGMRPIQTQANAGPEFRFEPVARPQGPLLVRAHHSGETYVAMVPPTPASWNAQQRVEVFEAVPMPADFVPRTALQVTKEPDRLVVSRIVAAHNRSRTTYRTDQLEIHVPAVAVDLRGSMQQEGSQMPVPLQLARNGDIVRIGRGLRPGNAAITLEYVIPGRSFEDAPPRNTADPGATAAPATVLWWRPADARPRVTGGRLEEVDTGNLGVALRIHYPPGGRVTLDFSAGSSAPSSAPRVEANPIFDSATVSLAGVVLFALVFFALTAVAVGSGLRLVRAGDNSGGRGRT